MWCIIFTNPESQGSVLPSSIFSFICFVWIVLTGESFDVRLREGASGERECVLCNPQIKGGKNIGGNTEDSHLMNFTGNLVSHVTGSWVRMGWV